MLTHSLKKAVMGLVLVFAASNLAGCASIVSGTSQTLTINTNPAGANCDLERDGRVIGQVIDTPGALVVQKTKHDIEITCEKEGYQNATGYLKSEIEGATWGNIILGGGIGWAIDSASGADNHYEEYTTLTLVPAEGGSVQASCDRVSLETVYMRLVEPVGEDVENYVAIGRHEVIYGRYNEQPEMVVSGFFRASFDSERDTGIGRACTQSQHISAAERALPNTSNGDFPEATLNPVASGSDATS